MKGVEIVDIKEQLHDFHKITIYYVYDQSFIGEMDFRFRTWTTVYHAKLFLDEICKARKPIEVLQSLNYIEIFMSLNGQLNPDKDSEIL